MQPFPVFKTKIPGKAKKLDLTDPKQTSEYFEYKAGEEIAKLRKYLQIPRFLWTFLVRMKLAIFQLVMLFG